MKDSGFTLIETLIAITLISLIGIPVFMIFSETLGFTEKIKDLNRRNRELIQLERVLRQSVGKIKIPFWIGDVGLIEEPGRIKIPYLNGDADSFLELKVEDSVFTITTPEGNRMFRGYDGVEFSLLKDGESQTVGLSIKVKKIKRDDMEFQCAFGAIGRDLFNEK